MYSFCAYRVYALWLNASKSVLEASPSDAVFSLALRTGIFVLETSDLPGTYPLYASIYQGQSSPLPPRFKTRHLLPNDYKTQALDSK